MRKSQARTKLQTAWLCIACIRTGQARMPARVCACAQYLRPRQSIRSKSGKRGRRSPSWPVGQLPILQLADGRRPSFQDKRLRWGLPRTRAVEAAFAGDSALVPVRNAATSTSIRWNIGSPHAQHVYSKGGASPSLQPTRFFSFDSSRIDAAATGNRRLFAIRPETRGTRMQALWLPE